MSGAVFLVNIILTFLLQGMRRIGPKRGAGISGWVSLMLGLLILVVQKGLTLITVPIALVLGIVAIFAILLIIFPALTPQANMGPLKPVIKLVTAIGFVIGYLSALILAFI